MATQHPVQKVSQPASIYRHLRVSADLNIVSRVSAAFGVATNSHFTKKIIGYVDGVL